MASALRLPRVGNGMDKRSMGAIVLGVVVAAVTFWLVRRGQRADQDMYVAPRAEWTPPHGDPMEPGSL